MAHVTSFFKSKGTWVFIFGALLLTISSIIGDFWGIKAPEEFTIINVQNYYAQQQAWQFRLIKMMGDVGLVIFTMSSIIIGIRSFRNKGISFKAVSFTLCGLLICLYHFLFIYMFLEVRKQNEELKVSELKKMESKISQKNLPSENKAFLSRFYAKVFYFEKGQKIKYITETGDSKLYEPTLEELKLREGRTSVEIAFGVTKKYIDFAIPYWISITVVSLLLGIFTPIKKTEIVGCSGDA